MERKRFSAINEMLFEKKTHPVKYKRIHHGDQQFQFNQHDKNFAQKYNLVRYHRTHNGNKPFHFNHCMLEIEL